MNAYCWIAAVICLAGTVINVRRVNWCFVIWAVGEAMWLAWDLKAGMVSRAILDAVGLALAVWGAWVNLIRKQKQPHTKKENDK